MISKGQKINTHSTTRTCLQGGASDLYLPSPSRGRQSRKVSVGLLRDNSNLSLHASFEFTAIALNFQTHRHGYSRFTVQLSYRKVIESSRKWQINCECVCWRYVSLYALTFPRKTKWIHFSWLCLYEAQGGNYWKLMNKWIKTKHRHTCAISVHPKGYISILNANKNCIHNTDKLNLRGSKKKKKSNYIVPGCINDQ